MQSNSASSLSDLKRDKHNPRKHGDRNLKTIGDSLKATGPHRSIVIDEDNNILAGNGVTEAALKAGISKVVVVEAEDGALIAVRKRGLTPEQKQAVKYFDNRSAELAEWDPSVILADLDAGVDLSGLWDEDELAELELELEIANSLLSNDQKKSLRQLGDNKHKIKPVLYIDELATFEQAILATGLKNRGQAIVEICRHYLEN